MPFPNAKRKSTIAAADFAKVQQKINSDAATFCLNTQIVSSFNSDTLGNHSAVLT